MQKLKDEAIQQGRQVEQLLLEVTDIKKQHQRTVDNLKVRHRGTLSRYKKEHAMSILKKNTKLHAADRHAQEMNVFYFELSDEIRNAKQLAKSSLKDAKTLRDSKISIVAKLKSQHQSINSLTDELCDKDNVIQELTEKVEQYKEVIDFIQYQYEERESLSSKTLPLVLMITIKMKLQSLPPCLSKNIWWQIESIEVSSWNVVYLMNVIIQYFTNHCRQFQQVNI